MAILPDGSMGKVASLIGRTRSIPCFGDGLRALGFETAVVAKDEPSPGDVLVLWNRLPPMDDTARRYEAKGCPVIICEHGWVGGEHIYAIALSQHNGAGRWFIGDKSRWPSFGIDVRPWREKGDHILVIPQRGMGTPPVAMPRDWAEQTVNRLSEMTRREVRVRNPKHRRTPLEPEFENCHAVVTWASGAGIKAIVHGVPVFHEMPMWIGERAARRFPYHDLEDPYLEDRSQMLHRASWAMWADTAIATGEPFLCVLRS